MKPAPVRFFRRSVLPHLTGLTLPLLVAGLAVAAGAWTCGPTEPEPELTTYTIEGEGEWAGTWEYVYNETEDDWEECTWYPADDPVDIPRDFVCGDVLVGLEVGVHPDDLTDLWDQIDAEIWRFNDSDRYPSVWIAVPVRTEVEAMLMAEGRSETRYAEPNFIGHTCGSLAC